MLKGSSESVLWFPGKKPEGVTMTPMTGRASEIAKSREELLGLLHDLPESEYELSLTDLVQKAEPQTDSAVPKDKIKTSLEEDVHVVSLVKERKKRRSSASSRGSSSEGVLLNVYLPSSLTRSLTTPHSAHRSPIPKAPTVEFSKRDREPSSLGCWSAIWFQGRGKWRRKGLERTV
ncbi:hypothetical protein J5N97_022842 [Dioscorea zingiberensis]|uniref:Uncharacterized protein n=1 Tax=Dioscorea zingiberensis TaxID=325984 RepID=A0A9D5CBY3_9LILI|nr:hypothetical protein J5N97_022842 [Dioscorea zingiberensis]